MRTLVAAGRRPPWLPNCVLTASTRHLEDFSICLAIAGARRAGRPYGLRRELVERECGCSSDPRVFGHQHEGR